MIHNSSKRSAVTSCLLIEGPPSTNTIPPLSLVKALTAFLKSTRSSPDKTTSYLFARLSLLSNGDDLEVSKIGEYSSDAKRGIPGSISKLLVTTTTRGNFSFPEFLRNAAIVLSNLGGLYLSSKTVLSPTKIKSAIPLNVLNNSRSSSPPSLPERPSRVANPLDEAIMFNMIQGLFSS